MEVLVALSFLTVAGERLAEWLLKPLCKQVPWSGEEMAQWGTSLICAVPGFAFSILANLDAFAGVGIYFNPPLAGVVVTAIFVGGGGNLIHIFVDRVQNGVK